MIVAWGEGRKAQRPRKHKPSDDSCQMIIVTKGGFHFGNSSGWSPSVCSLSISCRARGARACGRSRPWCIPGTLHSTATKQRRATDATQSSILCAFACLDRPARIGPASSDTAIAHTTGFGCPEQMSVTPVASACPRRAMRTAA